MVVMSSPCKLLHALRGKRRPLMGPSQRSRKWLGIGMLLGQQAGAHGSLCHRRLDHPCQRSGSTALRPFCSDRLSDSGPFHVHLSELGSGDSEGPEGARPFLWGRAPGTHEPEHGTQPPQALIVCLVSGGVNGNRSRLNRLSEMGLPEIRRGRSEGRSACIAESPSDLRMLQ
jgi:hypothetical protein